MTDSYHWVTGKHALIAGGSSGINLAFAVLLRSLGCNVLIGDLRPPPADILPISVITKPLVLYHSVDISNWDHLTAFFEFARHNFGPIAIVVPGAGISEGLENNFWGPTLERMGVPRPTSIPGPDVPGPSVLSPERRDSGWTPGSHKPSPHDGAGDSHGGESCPPTTAEATAATTSAADNQSSGTQEVTQRGWSDKGFSKVLDMNVTHPIRLAQLAIGYWVGKGMGGCIVFVGSMAGYDPVAALNSPVHVASRYAITGFVRSLWRVKEELGIKVGAVAPGAVKTSMWRDDRDKNTTPGQNLLHSFVPVEQVAQAMLQICENDEFGDGTILEVANGTTRVIPLYGAEPPTGAECWVLGYVEPQGGCLDDEGQLGETLKRAWVHGVD